MQLSHIKDKGHIDPENREIMCMFRENLEKM